MDRGVGKLSAPPPRLSTAPTRITAIPRGEPGRLTTAPWRAWYSTKRWRQLRHAVLLRDGYQCQWRGCGRIEPNASLLVADHKVPHRGDDRLFWDADNLQTLCKACHDGPKQRAEQGGRM